jgi:hypothetical protein
MKPSQIAVLAAAVFVAVVAGGLVVHYLPQWLPTPERTAAAPQASSQQPPPSAWTTGKKETPRGETGKEPSRHGTLLIKLSRSRLGPDYRVYVDGKIVVAHKARPLDLRVTAFGNVVSLECLADDGVNYQLGRVAKQDPLVYDQAGLLDAKDITIALQPGNHKVEVAVRVQVFAAEPPPNGRTIRPFPFVFHKWEVAIAAGQSRVLAGDVRVPLMWNGMERDRKELYSEAEANQAISDAQQRAASLKSDTVYVLLKETLAMLQQHPPTRPVVVLALDATCGGSREFDADQIRLLVDWLWDKWWGSLVNPVNGWAYGVTDTQDKAAAFVDNRLQQIKAIMQQSKEAVEPLQGIAVRLEQVSGDVP